MARMACSLAIWHSFVFLSIAQLALAMKRTIHISKKENVIFSSFVENIAEFTLFS
ncbi:hypothetical protein KIN20_018915 [Parelaphostrongylus tenuis]|uniref:Secreted protein n=1 Tax=Parelaphostrongylus tenuis TaxID=148309 RepID=A0AAD5N1N1_PARTN|nr:hypothetical protein KIN20_018915 [Parelaphostrongylus tenuis]